MVSAPRSGWNPRGHARGGRRTARERGRGRTQRFAGRTARQGQPRHRLSALPGPRSSKQARAGSVNSSSKPFRAAPDPRFGRAFDPQGVIERRAGFPAQPWARPCPAVQLLSSPHPADALFCRHACCGGVSTATRAGSRSGARRHADAKAGQKGRNDPESSRQAVAPGPRRFIRKRGRARGIPWGRETPVASRSRAAGLRLRSPAGSSDGVLTCRRPGRQRPDPARA